MCFTQIKQVMKLSNNYARKRNIANFDPIYKFDLSCKYAVNNYNYFIKKANLDLVIDKII